MSNDETFDSSNGGVVINLPDGSVERRDSVSVSDIKSLARQAGVRKFHVKGSNGESLQSRSFPVTSGSITIEEYNEAKHGDNYFTV